VFARFPSYLVSIDATSIRASDSKNKQQLGLAP
jgi:hypothetical protein